MLTNSLYSVVVLVLPASHLSLSHSCPAYIHAPKTRLEILGHFFGCVVLQQACVLLLPTNAPFFGLFAVQAVELCQSLHCFIRLCVI
ncbi:hypothetical protein EV127DRAFT_127949 [Xylaria flabelliformis]|nr:hypothetical protein EV127DRAFT_127949 [Xylaria flabelliformis]